MLALPALKGTRIRQGSKKSLPIHTVHSPLRLPMPLSDQFPVRVCSCPLCI